MANTDMLTKASLGQYGSTYLAASASLDLSGSSSTRYITAITMLVADTAFSELESLDGAVGFASTVTAENDLDNTADGIGAGGNGTDIGTSITFPAGVTIYGKWDKVIVHSTGSVIVYFAPKGF